MKFEKIRVYNFENALRGMRNPKNSWHLSDSGFGLGDWDCTADVATDVAMLWAQKDGKEYDDISDEEINSYNDWLWKNGVIYQDEEFIEYAFIGPKDMKLAKTLVKAGSEHRKFLRQIFVTVDITAPLYWWKEFDTYKVGTVANSTSTMHKLTSKPIMLDCFEIDDLDLYIADEHMLSLGTPRYIQQTLIAELEYLRSKYVETDDKRYWKELVRWLPESWLQTRTVTMNYENLLSIYQQRKNHKLTEWSGDGESFCHQSFVKFIKKLPYANDLITCEDNN